MNKLALLWTLLLVILPAPFGYGQTHDQEAAANKANEEKLLLIADLQSLNAQAANLSSPLARARARVEIADSLWYLNEESAKKVLTQVYELILPEEEERKGLRDKPIGADTTFLTSDDRARWEIRNRVMQVASRDRAFAEQLVKLSAEQMGKQEAHSASADLVRQALEGGDLETASNSILEAIKADPSLNQAPNLIREIARRDRAAADALIVKYIEQLHRVPVSIGQGMGRVFMSLPPLVFPSIESDQQPPGPSVIRAYASYLIYCLNQVKQTAPELMRGAHRQIMPVWHPVKEHAPELLPALTELLNQSGGANQPILTREEMEESARRNRERRINEALNSGTADEFTIQAAAQRGSYDKARKAVDKLPD